MSVWALVGLTLVAALKPADLERESVRATRQAFERAGRRAPQQDPALNAAARTLAERALRVGAEEAAEPSGVTEVVSAAHAADPNPRVLVVRSSPPEEALRAFRTHPDLAAAPATHLGVGSVVKGGRTAVVALFAERRVELAPFPRHLRTPGEARELCGELDGGFQAADVYVTRPSGDVEHLATRQERARFCGEVRFAQAGRHEVEVVARGPQGPQVVALFRVQVGAPPAGGEREQAQDREPTRVEDARSHVLQRVNALRRAHGRPPLAADPALDAVAQAYSERMAREGFFGHVAPDGSDLRQRLTRAGYRYRNAGENLGFAPGPLAAQRGIEDSPAHRGNLLSAAYTRMGIGVAYRERAGRRDVVLTQVLAEPNTATRSASREDVYAALNARRTAAQRSALTRNEVLERIAHDHARRAMAADEPSTELPGTPLHERVFAALPDLQRITVDLFVADGPTSLPESANLLDPRNDEVGIGFVEGNSPRFGPGRTWVVVIYATSR